MSATPPVPKSEPISPCERSTRIDAARGFAILGLAFVNLHAFASLDYYKSFFYSASENEGVDFWAQFFVEFFISGKCAAMLAFLLGFGIAMQERRAEAAGENAGRLIRKRMLILMVFGFVHMLLMWWGDILFVYGLLGLGVLFFRNVSSHTRRFWSAGLIGGWLVICLGLSAIPQSAEDVELAPASEMTPADLDDSEPVSEVESDEGDDWFEDHVITPLYDTYSGGSFLDVFRVRMIESLFIQIAFLFALPVYLGVAILGYDACRSSWFTPRDIRLTRPRWLGAIVVVSVGVDLFAAWLAGAHPLNPLTAAAYVLSIAADLVIAGMYLVLILRLRSENFVVRMMAPVGRMALTNYLLQSAVGCFVFHPYGLGWYERASFSEVVVLAAAIAIVQIIFSQLWLRNHRFGPMEWLWRRATYPHPKN